MRTVSVATALVGLALTGCGATDPAGTLPSPSPSPSPSSSAPSVAPATTVVPGTGEPYDASAEMRPDLMTVAPSEAEPGDRVELTFPEETGSGVAYVLERAFGDSWSTTHFLTSSADGYGGSPSAVAVDSAEGYGWEDIGIAGPGPDLVVIPDDAWAGSYRICTANALENFCAGLTIVVIDDGSATPAPETTTPATAPETTAPATAPETTAPATSPSPSPSTTTPVAIVAVHEGVAFYPACGNEILSFEGTTWYQLNFYDGFDQEYAAIYEAFAEADREPSPVVGWRGFAPAVVAPGPGDDVGTLVIWADGVARWVSESGDLDVWMVDDEITYNWEC